MNEHQKKFERDIDTCTSIGELFDVVGTYFHIREKLSPSVLAIVKSAIKGAIAMIKPKAK